MLLNHHDLTFELPDEWMSEAGAQNFGPKEVSYRVEDSKAHEPFFLVRIADIGPVMRNPGVGIFNNNELATAKERVVHILSGFCSDAALPPVSVVESRAGPYRYKLTAGVHRLYCSLAVGFSHIPAVTGFDMSDPNA